MAICIVPWESEGRSQPGWKPGKYHRAEIILIISTAFSSRRCKISSSCDKEQSS